MDDREQFFGEVSLWLVVGPFVLALCFFGGTLAFLSGRLFVDVVSHGGRIPSSAENASAN